MIRVGFGSLLLAVAFITVQAAEAYELERVEDNSHQLYWLKAEVKYLIHENGYSQIPYKVLSETIQKSFDTWNDLDCGGPAVVYGGAGSESISTFDPQRAGDNENTIIFREDDWYPAMPGVLALTTTYAAADSGEIASADIELNAAPGMGVNGRYVFTATDNAVLARHDLRNTLVHEIGHMLGLDHPVNENMLDIVPLATMYGRAPEKEFLKRTLYFDDVVGYCAIYSGRPFEPEGCSAITGEASSGAGFLSVALLLLLLLRRRPRRRN